MEWVDFMVEWVDFTAEWAASAAEWVVSAAEWVVSGEEVLPAQRFTADSAMAGIEVTVATTQGIDSFGELAILTGLTMAEGGGILTQPTLITATLTTPMFIRIQTPTLIQVPAMRTAGPTKPPVHRQMENRCI